MNNFFLIFSINGWFGWGVGPSQATHLGARGEMVRPPQRSAPQAIRGFLRHQRRWRTASAPRLDPTASEWDKPTVSLATMDAKRRVVLPQGRPGDVFDVQIQAEGRFLLIRLEPPKPPPPLSRKACLEALDRAPLSGSMTWEELRILTREP